jgi:hypothetical protein
MLFALILLTATGFRPVSGRTDKWNRYPVGNAGFSGEFPSEPEVQTKTITGVPGKLYLCISRDQEMNVFGAMFMEDVGVNTDKFSAAQLDHFYKTTAVGFKNGMLKGLGNLESTLEVTEIGQKQVTFVGLPGREFNYKVGTAPTGFRLTTSGHAMMMAWNTAIFKITDETLEKFFSGFQFSQATPKTPAMRSPQIQVP